MIWIVQLCEYIYKYVRNCSISEYMENCLGDIYTHIYGDLCIYKYVTESLVKMSFLEIVHPTMPQRKREGVMFWGYDFPAS